MAKTGLIGDIRQVCGIANRYASFKLLRTYQPLKLTVSVTNLCDSRCNTCDIWRLHPANAGRRQSELKVEDYFRLFNDVGKNLLWVEFTGGEPFLRDDLPDIVSYAYTNASITTGGITTNGLRTKEIIGKTKEILKRIPNHKTLTLGVSIDGDPDIYFQARGVNRFNDAIATYLELRELKTCYANLNPHLAYTFSQFNAGRLATCSEFLARRYNVMLDEFSFALQHFARFYHPEDKNNSGLTIEQKTNITSDINFVAKSGNNRRRGMKFSLAHMKQEFYHSIYLPRISDYLSQPGKQIIPCTACKLSAYIDPFGTVYPCTMWDLPLGSLKEREFHQIWNSEAAANARKTIATGGCPNCWTPCEAQPSFVGNLERCFWKILF